MNPPLPHLPDLLNRTAAQLRQCRAVVVQLEDAVHALIDKGGPQSMSGPLADLQAIDLLDQRLNDLALWADALARATIGCHPDRSARDLTQDLRLAEMRTALAGADMADPVAAGHTEFF